jgi:FeS assembly SUF system protein
VAWAVTPQLSRRKSEAEEKSSDQGQGRMKSEIEARIVEVLKTIFDPEIPVNIYEIGLIYNVDVDEEGHAHVLMTLTSPMCPVAESLPPEVEQRVSEVDGVSSATVELTWDPPWDPDMMSEAAKLELGMY